MQIISGIQKFSGRAEELDLFLGRMKEAHNLITTSNLDEGMKWNGMLSRVDFDRPCRAFVRPSGYVKFGRLCLEGKDQYPSDMVFTRRTRIRRNAERSSGAGSAVKLNTMRENALTYTEGINNCNTPMNQR